jgi:hypothetical protein
LARMLVLFSRIQWSRPMLCSATADISGWYRLISVLVCRPFPDHSGRGHCYSYNWFLHIVSPNDPELGHDLNNRSPEPYIRNINTYVKKWALKAEKKGRKSRRKNLKKNSNKQAHS